MVWVLCVKWLSHKVSWLHSVSCYLQNVCCGNSFTNLIEGLMTALGVMLPSKCLLWKFLYNPHRRSHDCTRCHVTFKMFVVEICLQSSSKVSWLHLVSCYLQNVCYGNSFTILIEGLMTALGVMLPSKCLLWKFLYNSHRRSHDCTRCHVTFKMFVVEISLQSSSKVSWCTRCHVTFKMFVVENSFTILIEGLMTCTWCHVTFKMFVV
jgi:hypothetical protein